MEAKTYTDRDRYGDIKTGRQRERKQLTERDLQTKI